MEDPRSILNRAVHVVFAEWTAIGLAVENEWGGRATRDKALALLHQVLNGLLNSERVHADEIEALLDSTMLDEFNIEAEDDSPAQIARLLCIMHAEARAGTSTTALALLAEHASKRSESNWVVAPLPPKPEADSSDDEDDGEDSMAVEGRGGGSSGAPREREEPTVDEDGFQMVTRSGGGRRR